MHELNTWINSINGFTQPIKCELIVFNWIKYDLNDLKLKSGKRNLKSGKRDLKSGKRDLKSGKVTLSKIDEIQLIPN